VVLPEKCCVLIVGAGPTGLSLAIQLRRYGVECCIVDRETKATSTSNALAVQSRTCAIMDELGILEDALRIGKKVLAFNIYCADELLVRANFKALETRFPYMLGISQAQTEALLIERLSTLGVEVARGISLSRLEPEKESVRAIFDSDRESALDAQWVIGCDGGGSQVRKQLDISFEGKKLTEHFVMADVELDTKLDNNEVHAFLSSDGALGMIPVGCKGVRIIAEVTQDLHYYQKDELSQSDFQHLLDQRTLKQGSIQSTTWISKFRVQQRLASTYNVGRCFIAGDAAHLHSPVGGQGMNTGIQDAYNLAWKLAHVIKHKADPSILKTYELERKPIAQAVLRSTTLGTHLLSLKFILLQRLRNYFIKKMARITSVRKRMVRQISELDIHYDTPLNIDQAKNALGPVPGDYIDCVNGLDLNQTDYHALVFTNQSISVNDLERLKSNLRVQYQAIHFHDIYESEEGLYRYFHIEKNGAMIYVVRPDKYLCHRLALL